MDEQFIRDTQRKYSNTVIGVRLDSEEEVFPVAVSDVLFTTDGAVVLGTVVRENKMQELSVSLKSVDFLPMPKSQVFDYKGITYVYTHKTERQWSRGICSSNSAIECPAAMLLQAAENSKIRVGHTLRNSHSLEVLSNLIKSQPVSLQEALKQIDNGECISKTVTKQCFVSMSLHEDIYLLWWMGRIIAKFNPKQRVAWVLAPLFKQEVFDFFHRQGQYYGIEG